VCFWRLEFQVSSEKFTFIYLRKRYSQHSKGQVSSTKDRLPVQIVYYEMCLEQSDAYAREKYLKTGMGKRYINNRLKRFLSLTD
jgi:putative endonuclease